MLYPDADTRNADWPKRTKDVLLADKDFTAGLFEFFDSLPESRRDDAEAFFAAALDELHDGSKALEAAKDFFATLNFNPYHDERGRFSRAEGHAAYVPDVEKTRGGGVSRASRVGVPGDEVPPPPAVGRLPNLNERERAVQDSFIAAYEKDPDGIAASYRSLVHATTKPGEAQVFATDDAKALTDAWSHPDPTTRAANRATLNTPLHQAANAIAKRAFLQELDSQQPGGRILVTVGGCGAGKGYALKQVPEALELKRGAKVVWDSAGDQNATENPWIQKEAEKRGLKVDYVYVHADPETQWAHPERGVVKRAQDPADGRMVDSHVYADSYAIGAKNHEAFYRANKDNPNASFMFLHNKAAPEKLAGIPEAALRIDRKALTAFATETVNSSDAPEHVKAGGTIGERIWR